MGRRRSYALPDATTAGGVSDSRWQGFMLRRHAQERGSEGGNGRTPAPAPWKGGQMRTKHGKDSRFTLNLATRLGTM